MRRDIFYLAAIFLLFFTLSSVPSGELDSPPLAPDSEPDSGYDGRNDNNNLSDGSVIISSSKDMLDEAEADQWVTSSTTTMRSDDRNGELNAAAAGNGNVVTVVNSGSKKGTKKRPSGKCTNRTKGSCSRSSLPWPFDNEDGGLIFCILTFAIFLFMIATNFWLYCGIPIKCCREILTPTKFPPVLTKVEVKKKPLGVV